MALADIQELYVNGLREDHPKGARPLSLGRRRLRRETFGVDHLRTPCPVDAGVAHQVHGGEALRRPYVLKVDEVQASLRRADTFVENPAGVRKNSAAWVRRDGATTVAGKR